MNISNLKGSYQNLDSRDQTALKILAAFAGLMVLIYGFILPAYNYYDDSKARFTEQQKLLEWVKQNSSQIKPLATTPQKNTINKPIMETTTSVAKALGVEINRLQPEGENLRAWLTQVPFDKVINLLTTLKKQHSIDIQQITVEKTAKSGIVNIQCLLQKF